MKEGVMAKVHKWETDKDLLSIQISSELDRMDECADKLLKLNLNEKL